jgi:hypothetical protein
MGHGWIVTNVEQRRKYIDSVCKFNMWFELFALIQKSAADF